MQCLLVVLVAAAMIAACESGTSEAADYSSVVQFDSTPLRIVAARDTVTVVVQIARSRAQKTQGLMERSSLPEFSGMLFLYDTLQPADAGFWMYRTRIPLDIAFTDSTGVIVAVRQMVPCTAQLAAGCPTYAPGAPYRAALEVNQGFFARHGIAPGSRLLLTDTARR